MAEMMDRPELHDIFAALYPVEAERHETCPGCGYDYWGVDALVSVQSSGEFRPGFGSLDFTCTACDAAWRTEFVQSDGVWMHHRSAAFSVPARYGKQ